MTMLFESPATSTRIGGYSDLFMRPATSGGDSAAYHQHQQHQHEWPTDPQQQPQQQQHQSDPPHHHQQHQQQQSLDQAGLYGHTPRASMDQAQRPPSTADSAGRRPGTAGPSYDSQLGEQLVAAGGVKAESSTTTTPSWAHQPPPQQSGFTTMGSGAGPGLVGSGGFGSMDFYQARPMSAEGLPSHYGGRGQGGSSFPSGGGVGATAGGGHADASSTVAAATAAAAMYGGVGSTGAAGGYHYRPMSSSSSASSPTMAAQTYGYPPLGYGGPASALSAGSSHLMAAGPGPGGGGGGGGPSLSSGTAMYASYPSQQHSTFGHPGGPSSYPATQHGFGHHPHHHSMYDHGMNRPVPYSPFEVKHRRRTTKAQFTVLENAFANTPKPTAEARKQISEQIGMDSRSVQIWFQNRRAKAKTALKKAQQAADQASSDAAEGKGPLVGSSGAGSSSSSVNDPIASTSSTSASGMPSSSSSSSLPVAVPRRPSMYTSFSSPSDYSHRSSGSSMSSMAGWPSTGDFGSSTSAGFDAADARKMSMTSDAHSQSLQTSPHMMGGYQTSGPGQWRSTTTMPYGHQQQPGQGGEGSSRGTSSSLYAAAQHQGHQQYQQQGEGQPANYGIFYPPPGQDPRGRSDDETRWRP